MNALLLTCLTFLLMKPLIAEEARPSFREVSPPEACNNSSLSDHRISKDKPELFLTYEGQGIAKDRLNAKLLEVTSRDGTKGKGGDLLLRLYNNSCLPVSISTYGTYISQLPEFLPLPDGARAFALPDGAEIGVVYEVREEDGEIVPTGGIDVMSRSWLPAGRSILFAVRRDHLRHKRIVSVSFNYEWENGQAFSSNLAPVHRVEFHSYRLSSEGH